MTPLNIVGILTAAAPIVASVASACKSDPVVEVRKEKPSVTYNINVTYNNYFYGGNMQEAATAMEMMHKQVASFIPPENRYSL